MSRPLADEPDVIAVDTTWGTLQRFQPVPGVPTVGELEVIDCVDQLSCCPGPSPTSRDAGVRHLPAGPGNDTSLFPRG